MKLVGYYNQYGYYNFTIMTTCKKDLTIESHYRFLDDPFQDVVVLHVEFAVIMKEIFTKFYCLKIEVWIYLKCNDAFCSLRAIDLIFLFIEK